MPKDRPPTPAPLVVLGIMSGTSLDGVDYALCQVAPSSVTLEAAWHCAFPKAMSKRLRECAGGAMPSHALGQLHHDLGRFYAQGAGRARRLSATIRPKLIGLHGQTIYHQPDPPFPATFQLGEHSTTSCTCPPCRLRSC